MKKILFLLLLVFYNITYAQLVVNTTTQTPAQLVQNVLLGSGITVSNITFNGSALNANQVRDQVGSFTGGNTTNIGINNGIILATGDAQLAIGPNNQTGATNTTSNPIQGDADLAALASANIRNKAVLEFDFVPVGQNLSFNFVFASEEYLEFVGQGYNDVFGFFLSGPGIVGTYTGGAANIALVPATTTPISIDNLNDTSNSTYYVNNGTGATPAINATIQYDGFTTVIAATATVQCGQTYHIKLAIANVGDNLLDSAVFLQAQSFNTAQLSFPQDYLVSNGFAPCPGTPTTLNTGLAATIPHTWTWNGNPMAGETGPTITINQAGTYCATAYPYGPGCPISDCVIVEYLPPMPIDDPINLTVCAGSTFNLSINNAIILNGQSAADYEISYHNSFIDAQNIAAPINNLTNYPSGINGEQIWVAIQDLASGSNCVAIKSFFLNQLNTTIAPVITCGVSTSSSVAFDWTPLSGATNYTVSYQVNSNAPISVGSIGNTSTYSLGGLTSGDNVNFTLTPIGASGSCFVSASLTCNALTSCPTITNPSSNQELCLDGDPAPFSVTTAFTGTDAINYVYFNTQQTGGNMYIGGTFLGNATPTSSVATYDAPSLGNVGSLPNAAGTYYVYAIANPAPSSSTCRPFQEIQVVVIPQPNAGTNGTLTVCQGTTPTNAQLFAALNGTPSAGGTWSNVGLVYTYTVNATAPCTTPATATVTVTQQAQPNAGSNGTLTVCQGTTPTNAQLFAALNGTPSAGGTWSNVGLVYTYTVNATAPCTTPATATVTVTQQAQPNAGSNGTLTVCQGTTPTNAQLFAALNGTPSAGGTWSNVGLVYTYTVNATAPCTTPATATVTVTQQAQPNAGTNGTLTVCQGTTPTNAQLFAALNGTPSAGGTWSNVGLVYTYTVNATAPCTTPATATVTVTQQAQPNAGTNGTLTVCQGTTPTNAQLFAALNGTPTAGGTWSNVGLVYTYTVNATAPCTTPATATVTVTQQAQPNAGTDGTLTVCQGTTPTNAQLFAALTGTPSAGGTWSNVGLVYTYTVNATAPCTTPATATVTVTQQAQPNAGTNGTLTVCQGTTPTNAQLFAALNGTPTAGGTWSNVGLVYTYTVNATAPCTTPATATVTVTQQAQPNAGTNGTLTVCQGTTPTNAQLFAALNGTPSAGGTWSNLGLVYTYTVNATAPCTTPATATVTVTQQAQPNAGTDGGTTICQSSTSVIDLFSLISGEQAGGSWTRTGGTGGVFNAAAGTFISAAGATTSTFTYTLTGVAPCSDDTSSATISIIGSPTITPPSNYVVCDDNNDGESCLFDLTTRNSQISTQLGIQISYHLTPTDAQTGFNAINTAVPYCNITNPQTIHVRVFDPLAPACSSYTSFQLIVTPKPVATTVSDYHLCDSNLSPTITEAVFNLTGVVTPQVLGTLSPLSHTVTYYTSLADAQVPTNAISALAAQGYTSPTTTLWIRVQNNTTGCFDSTTINLVVDQLPNTPPFYPQYELCETDAPVGIESFNLNSQLTTILSGLTGMQVTFYPSLTEAQLGTGAITNTAAYPNAITFAQTLGIRITNTATECYSIATMDLVVNPKPEPVVPTTPYTVCDEDEDGFSEFDLSTLTPEILLGAPGVYDISYFLTQIDAVNNVVANSINPNNPYFNNVAFVQFLYVRAEDPNTGCFTVFQIELNVDPAPVMPTTLPIIANCDDVINTNTQDSCTTFNLTIQTPIILAAQTVPASNYTVTYYTSLANASTTPNGTLPIFNTTNYTACGTTTIWVRVQNNATGCFQVGSFQLQVNTPIVLTTPTLLSVCDNDNLPNDDYTTFDMLGFIAPSVPTGHTIAFYISDTYTPANLISNSSAFINTTPGSQTVFIVVTNTTTGCKSYRTLTVQVLPVPTPNTNMAGLELKKCDTIGPNDGSEIFDLTTNAAYIANGNPNVTLHYYPSETDAILDQNEIIPATAANVSDNVWIRVESTVFTGTNGQNCYVLVEQPVIVNPVPIIVPNSSFQGCDDDTDGFILFDLNGYASTLLAGNPLPITSYTLNFYFDSAATIPISSNYTNTSNPQTIYVRATNSATGCFGPVEPFTIFVNPKPLATAPLPFNHCDDDTTNDGFYNLNLNNYETAILTGQPNTNFTVTFYDTQAAAQAGTNPIVDEVNYMAYTHTIWVRVENNTTNCFKIVSFNATVEPLPDPNIYTSTGSNVICVDYNTQIVVRPLTLMVNNNNPMPGTYTYQWYEAGVAIPGATSATYAVPPNATGDTRIYTVKMTSVSPPQLGCDKESDPFTVIQSGQAVAIGVGYEISNAFSDTQTIIVNVTGYGEGSYLYSLDGGPRQTSNVFENVPLGVHTITVWDDKGGVANSCDPFQISGVQIIDYPHYFTPNGDGINDYWNIVGLDKEINTKIYIFDRQGKLIKQISPASKGWDGTYNGNLMPSTDYWFTVDYPEAGVTKQFKAHFSLKR